MTGESINAQEFGAALNNQQVRDQINEENRRNIQTVCEDDEFFYTENEEVFQDAMIARMVQSEYWKGQIARQYHTSL